MSATAFIEGQARRFAVVSNVALIALGGMACSSTTPPAPTDSATTSTGVLTSTSPAPKRFVMPNLVGQIFRDALSKLNSLGWTGLIDKGPDVPVDPHQRNRIVVQSPAPGEQLNSDGRIRLQFGV